MKRLLAALIGAIWPILVLIPSAQTSRAASATWLPAPLNGDWNDAANWTVGGPPNDTLDTATFSTSSQTSLTFSADVEVDGIVFDQGASPYTIATSPTWSLTVSGIGITNNSGITQNFVVDGILAVFMNNATAGNSTNYLIRAGGTNGNPALVYFFNSSTAGGGTFMNTGSSAAGGGGGETLFYDTATAGNGTLINEGGSFSGGNGGSIFFAATSTAGNATLTTNGGAVTGALGGLILIYENANADSATITANGGANGGEGGEIEFGLDSTGGTSRIRVFDNALLDISLHNDPGLTIGSLEGNGTVLLGGRALTVGSNNLSTTFSGVIEDGGSGTVSSLAKIGTGTLTFEGNTTNNYIEDTVTLTLVSGSTINLNFTGAPDTIGALIVDGVPQAPGVYGSAVSGAPNPLPELTGSGQLQVSGAPTPSPTPGPPVIISPLTAVATVGQPFVYQFEATGATSLAVSGLPPNLTFDPGLAAIVGSPTAPGTFPITLSALNALGKTTATLNLTVQSPPSSGPIIINSTSVTGRVGRPFTFRVLTIGGSPAARLSATGLPAGIMADAVTGIISGTAISEGSFPVTLTVTDGNLTTSSLLQLTFSADPALPVIVSPGTASLTVGQPFSYTIVAPSTADPSSDPTIFTLIGTLPAGLGFDPAAGVISGIYSPRPGSGGIRPDSPNLAGGALLGSVQLFGTNSHGTSTFQLLFLAAPSGLVNISTRLQIGIGENVLIGGLIITGNSPKVVIIRAIGPSLTGSGVIGALQDPVLELHDGAHPSMVVINDNWKDTQEQIIRDTGIPPAEDHESAIVAGLDPGNYTAILSGKGNTTGVAVLEAYDLGTASLDASGAARLAEISTRGTVLTGSDVMIGGFIISGTATRVVVRAIGPSLSAAGVPNALQDTVLELRDGSGSLIVSNDDWRSTQAQEIIKTGVAPTDDRESAIVATLNPGPYTGIVYGKGETTGVALVEIYGLQ